MLIASTSTDKTFAVRGAEGPGSNYAHLHRVALPNGLMLHLIIAHTQRCPLKRAACNLKWKTFYCPTHISRRIGIQNRPGTVKISKHAFTRRNTYTSAYPLSFVAALLHWSNVPGIVSTSARGDSSGSTTNGGPSQINLHSLMSVCPTCYRLTWWCQLNPIRMQWVSQRHVDYVSPGVFT